MNKIQTKILYSDVNDPSTWDMDHVVAFKNESEASKCKKLIDDLIQRTLNKTAFQLIGLIGNGCPKCGNRFLETNYGFIPEHGLGTAVICMSQQAGRIDRKRCEFNVLFFKKDESDE